MKRKIIPLLGLLMFFSCNKKEIKEQQNAKISILKKVDITNALLRENIKSYQTIAVLDHHRMAQAEGVYTPPSILTIFSDSAINSELLLKDQLIGLDLPFKILTYSEPDTTGASIAYTSADFIQKRHNLTAEDVSNYRKSLTTALNHFDEHLISKTKLDSVSKGFGMIQIPSDFDFQTTIKNLKAIVHAQNDTKWFGEIDYQKQAKNLNIKIEPTTLLLFGAPKPGAMAMITSPKIGLDAFCQKLLVYEQNGKTVVAFNDIVAFSKLYYHSATKPQIGINQRLITTFTKAITIQKN